MIELDKSTPEEKAELENEARRLEFYKSRVRIIPFKAARCKAQGCYGQKGYYGVDWKNGNLLLCCGDFGETSLSHIEARLAGIESGMEAIYKVTAFGQVTVFAEWFAKILRRKARAK